MSFLQNDSLRVADLQKELEVSTSKSKRTIERLREQLEEEMEKSNNLEKELLDLRNQFNQLEEDSEDVRNQMLQNLFIDHQVASLLAHDF
jgi:predicted  nucleic acid-binding Zn-ribbon protein